MRNVTILLAVLAVVAMAAPARAATCTWNNADPNDNYWASNDNWVDDVAPTASDNVTINCDTSNKCEVQTGTTANFNELYVGNGTVGHLDVYGNMTQGGGYEFKIGRNNVAGESTLTQYSGDISANYTVDIGYADWACDTGDAKGKYEIRGGSLNLGTRTLTLGGAATGGSAPPAGATSSGTLKIVGSASSGIDVGYYNQGSTSTLELVFDGDSNPITKINITNWDESNTLAGTLTVTDSGTTPDGTYTIIDYSAYSGTGYGRISDDDRFDTVNLPSGWTIDYGDGTDDQVTITVPEPATMMLLGIGGIGVLIRRRRK
jgi:hypothetical protein